MTYNVTYNDSEKSRKHLTNGQKTSILCALTWFRSNLILGVLILANSAQAKKRARQAEKRRQHNTSLRSMMRTAIKKVVYAIDAGEKDTASEAYKKAVPVIDSMANKNIITANKAARHKSRLNTRIRAL